MNIGIDLRALTSGTTSGVTVYLRSVLEELIRINKDNYYYLWWNAGRDTLVKPPEFKSPLVKTIVTHYSNLQLNLKLKLQKKPELDRLILTEARRGHEQMDLFWLPDPRPVALSPDCALVATIHDLASELYPQFFSRKTRLWHSFLNPADIARRADRVITVSQSTAKDVQRHWKIPEENINAVSLGVRADLQRVKTKSELRRLREKYILPEHFVLSLGTLEPRKNLITLIRAFEQLKCETDLPHHLVLAGSQNPGIFSDPGLYKYDWIHYPGLIAEADKAALLSAADCFCFPSVYEGFGLPVLEALKVGTPVLASDISALHEVAGNVIPYIYPPRNIDAWSVALRRVLTGNDTLGRLQTAGLKQAQKFSWHNTAQKTLEIFEEVVQERKKFVKMSL